jgi:threonine dehydrogenase-like Zn-dependent dehydrogenase
MKAVCFNGKHDVRVETVPDPQILNETDAIVEITSTAICGSDLHLYNGYIPSVMPGDILGHEFMGRVVDVGKNVETLKVGDRVVVPFTISCGSCFFCERTEFSLCDNSNPNAASTEQVYGSSPAAIYGYSHLYGGYDGGQAQYARVPFADVGPLKVPDHLTDDQVILLSDVFPTGYMAAENADISEGDVVAVWGCGPVGQFAIRSALMLGAERVIAIDREPERLQMAARAGNVETMNFEKFDVVEELHGRTGGRGPDSCIDAVGLEALGHGAGAVLDWTKQVARMQSDRPNVLRQAIQACRKGGTISIPGVYGGIMDAFNFGAAFNKGLTFRMGQTHVQRYMQPLLERIENGDIDPTFLFTHRIPLRDAPKAYEMFKHKQDGCVKVILEPDKA